MNGVGIIGEPYPYLLQNDGWVVALLVYCFLSTGFVLAWEKAQIFYSIRKLFFKNELEYLFPKQSIVDFYCRFLLILQTCVLIAILVWAYQVNVLEFDSIPTHAPLWLGLYCVVAILFCVVKWCLYKFINWIFYDKKRSKVWIENYFFIFAIFGMILLPVTLCVIYCNLPFQLCKIIPLFLLFLALLILIYKGFCIFFSHLHGVFYLFLYFCTLEIIPLLVAWKGIEMVNGIFI